MDLERHANNLKWNIDRIYRCRNEIVHAAATDIDVIDLTGHLKYYLTYTINCFLDFLLNCPLDINQDKKITIDDFFILGAIRYNSLFSKNAISIEDLILIENPVEYLHNNK